MDFELDYEVGSFNEDGEFEVEYEVGSFVDDSGDDWRDDLDEAMHDAGAR